MKIVYVSSCFDVLLEMECISVMMLLIIIFSYVVFKKRRLFVNMMKEDWNLILNYFILLDEYLLLLFNGYFNDDICLFGMILLVKYVVMILK